MVIIIKSDWDEIDHELDRLSSQPTAKAHRLLDGVLHKGFALSQAAVHEETGALKASGRESSDVDKATHTWEGQIDYGNDTTVDYAIYEKERGVGGAGGPSDAKGDHDFIRPLEALDPLYRAAIKEALRP